MVPLGRWNQEVAASAQHNGEELPGAGPDSRACGLSTGGPALTGASHWPFPLEI